jgi:hypothetical protein
MWIPNPIYEALPVIYPGIGLASVAVLGVRSPALISAALLVAASLAITVARRRYRAALKAEQAHSDRQRRRRKMATRRHGVPT